VTDLVTFFRPRKGGSNIYEFVAGDANFAICTSAQLASLPSREARPADVREWATSQIRTGGILVEITPETNNLRVELIAGNNYQPPSRMLILPADREPKPERLNAELTFVPGSHYLIPCDAAAQEVLNDLVESLNYLSQDQQWTVLNALRRPNLELRVQLLETALIGRERDGVPGGSRGSYLRESTPRDTKFWLLVAAIILLVLIIIGVPLYLVYRDATRSRANLQQNAPITSNSRPPGPDSNSGNPKPAAALPFEKDAQDLKTAMFASPNKSVQGLYESHLAKVTGNRILESREFGIAALKLELLRLTLLRPNSNDLDNPENMDDSLRAPLPTISAKTSTLAYIACTYNKSMAQPNDPVRPNINGVPILRESCDPPTDAKSKLIEGGFAVLIAFAKRP